LVSDKVEKVVIMIENVGQVVGFKDVESALETLKKMLEQRPNEVM